METVLIRALQFFMAISLLVFVHEGGHFLFSKLFGVRVNKFYVFFDWRFHIFSTYSKWWRRLRGKKPVERDEDGEYVYDGTEYGMGWIPLGGYCQIDGMIDETQLDLDKLKSEPKPYEFRGKPTWQRLLIMLGGIIVNFVTALVIYAGVLYTWGEDFIAVKDMTMGMKFNTEAQALGFRDGDVLLGTEQGDFREFSADVYRDISTATEARIVRGGKPMTLTLPGDLNLLSMLKTEPVFMRPLIPAEIAAVAPGTPAALAGIKKGDKILSLNGHRAATWNEVSYEEGILADRLTECLTRADSLRVRRVTLTLATNGCRDTISRAITLTPELMLGVQQTGLYDYYKPTTARYSLLQSIPAGARYGCRQLEGYVSDMKYVFTADGAKSLGGFGTIAKLFPEYWDWLLFWKMTAFLSIILAFMNFIPIPGLDGGHVLFLLCEMVTRRKLPDRFLLWAQYFGMGFLLLLMIVANLNDVLRWLGLMA